MPPQFQTQFNPTNVPPENNPTPLKSSRRYGFLITLAVLLILTGIFGAWYFSQPSLDEDTGTSAITNKFADWKTYTNTEYGFEFKYPTLNTNVQENIIDRGISKTFDFAYLDKIDNQYRSTFHFGVVENTSSSTLQQWFEKNVGDVLLSNGNFVFKKIVGGGAMYMLDKLPLPPNYGGGPVALAYIMPPDEKYVFIFNLGQDSGNYSVQDYESQILSTFKFIPSTGSGQLSTSTPAVETDRSDLDLSVPNNVILLMTDSSGKQTGSDPVTKKTVENIPQSSYFTDCLTDDITGEPAAVCTTSLDINQPNEGKYTLSITGNGDYKLSIRAFAKDGSPEPPITINGAASNGVTEKYIINFAKSSGAITTITKL